MDYPYDNSLIFVSESSIKTNFYVKIQLCGDSNIETIAEYSSKEKALKVMEVFREVYNSNEFYHCTATTNTFHEAMGLLSSEKFKEATSEYFRFPQDDEVEV